MGVFFWGCFQEFVYKVCVSERRVCFCSSCVSGSPFLKTTNAVRMCVMCLHLCLRLCGGGRTSACVCVHACVCMCSCVSVSIAEGGVLSVPQPGASLCVCSVFVPVWAAASHLVCLSLCSLVPIFAMSLRACDTARAHLCPWMCQCVLLHGVGAPACACVCTPPTRAHSFFGTDTLPPSAQTNSKSPPAGSEPGAAGAPGFFSFLFPFLQLVP